MTNPTIYSGSERILRAGVFCTLLDLTLTMEQQIGNGASVSEAAAQTWYEANQENLSWFMYGNAVRVLVNFWDHGEELQQWQHRAL